ncbi:hypothetical protein [Nocardia wallacei]|uniref:Uncharacterized protein n=1 Tax=Nocardia wallacei TaxID=480035 RepID=A0A7G1KKV9_9NOCA|nr:hypothetical protein [Nocardia wallacei]BCK54863.1 hypothetical protein NWFMUON74_26350 [Nocardia wallacei]
MKRLLFLLMAIIIALSTLDYSQSAGHYGILIAGGVVALLLLADKLIE